MGGPTIAVPAPAVLSESIESVEVTHADGRERSGFQITFQVGRNGPADVIDFVLMSNAMLKVFNRVVLVVTFGAKPQVLFDGIITNQQLTPGSAPGESKLTITGEDVSIMMDRKEMNEEHPAQPEAIIALKLIAKYAQYGMIPKVIPPVSFDVPIPIERIPVQRATDLQYIKQMAERFNYTFYVTPGPVPLTNTAYWGPRIRVGVPQPALSVNLGSETNVESINFAYDGLKPRIIKGKFQDRQTNKKLPVLGLISTIIPIVPFPALLVNYPNAEMKLPDPSEDLGGKNTLQATARAIAKVNESAEEVVSASGVLDAARYGNILHPRGLVGLRGAGFNNDGLYYVKSVTHSIKRGEYKQRFTLTREGYGSITPVVRP